MIDEHEIPIEVHTLKLLDWLVSRRIVPKNAQNTLKGIHVKIEHALRDMPSNAQLVDLIKSSDINYYQCKEIYEILKGTEKHTRNVFGSYGSQCMKNWQEIISMYEKNNVYLAEAAQIFQRNVKYEVPGIRKQITRLDQQKTECLRKVQDLGKTETQIAAEYSAMLRQLGVDGHNLNEELNIALAKLPALYAEGMRNIESTQRPLDLYVESCGKATCLPLLRHLIRLGNTTVYEYTHKTAPSSVELPDLKLEIVQASNENVSGGEAVYDLLDLDTGTIDFGDDVVESATSVATSGTAKGGEAYTLLDSPQYRDRILDELYELEAFLRLRLHELQQSDASASVMLSTLDGTIGYDTESITRMLTDVGRILSTLSGDHLHMLFHLKHSVKCRELLATKVKQFTRAEAKIRNQKVQLNEQAEQLNQQVQDLHPVLDELIGYTKQLRSHIESDISKRYKNRIVNLLGSAA